MTSTAKTRPNWEIVLHALQEGIEIDLPGGYRAAWQDNKLCYIFDVWTVSNLNEDPDEIRYIESDITLNNFIDVCENLSAEEIVGIIFSITMEKKKHDRG